MTPEIKLAIKRACIKWCIEDCLEYSRINGPGLKLFLSSLYQIISNESTTIDTQDILPSTEEMFDTIKKMSAEYRPLIAEQLKSVKFMGVSCYYWRFKEFDVICVAVCYIDNGKMVQRVLSFSQYPLSHIDMFNKPRKVGEILTKFKINDMENRCYFVSDFSPINPFTTNNNLNCFGCVLNKLMEENLFLVDEIFVILKKCKCILYSLPDVKDEPNFTFHPIPFTVKWTYKLHQLDYVIENWPTIQSFFEGKKLGAVDNLHEIENIEFLRNLSAFLKQFEKATDDLNNVNEPSIHKVIPYMEHLIRLCVKDQDDDYRIKSLKGVMRSGIEKTWRTSIKLPHEIALFLYPPFKKLIRETPERRNELHITIAKLMSSLNTEQHSKSTTPPLPSPKDVPEFFDLFYSQKPSTETDIIESEEEIRKYLAESVTPNVDIMDYWELRKHTFKRLYTVFQKIMAIPATNYFCQWDNLQHPNNPETFFDLTILKSNLSVDKIDLTALLLEHNSIPEEQITTDSNSKVQ